MVEALTKLGEAARRAREYISPWAYLSPSDVASNLPGGGIPAAVEPYKQGLQKTAQATQAFREGRWGDAARWYGSGMLDTATAGLSALPEGGAMAKLAMAAAPAIKAAVGASEAGADGAGAMQKLSGIRAFHGSPHDFDRFDMSKIGTGEGAQAYGHGLYFAENEGVAKGYRDTLTSDRTVPANRLLAKHSGDVDAALAAARAEIARLQWLNLTPETGLDRARSMIETQENNIAMLEALKNTGQMSAGRMYEVRINADPEHFLDWDKPFIEQSEAVRRGLDEAGFAPPPGGELMKGSELYQRMNQQDAGAWNSPKEFSANALRELGGIPGIKYLDAGSRGAGDGTRNYVVFDDKLVEIIRKYGWMPGMAIPAAMALEMQQAQEQSAPQM